MHVYYIQHMHLWIIRIQLENTRSLRMKDRSFQEMKKRISGKRDLVALSPKAPDLIIILQVKPVVLSPPTLTMSL
jgi:hypothetical protein